MTSPQARAGAGTTLNPRARGSRGRGGASQTDREKPNLSPYVGHIRELAEARRDRVEWKPSKPNGQSRLSMQKEICATFNNLDLATFEGLVALAIRSEGPWLVRSFLEKRLNHPDFSFAEYLSNLPSVRNT